MRTTRISARTIAAACATAAPLIALLAPWAPAHAQQCIGTNRVDLQRTLATLTHVDQSQTQVRVAGLQQPGGLELYHDPSITAVVNYFNDDSRRLNDLKDQAHANRAALPQFAPGNANVVVDLLVFTAPEKKHMCPDRDIGDQHALTSAQREANSITSDGHKKDAVYLYLVGGGEPRPLIGVVRMTEATNGARLTLTIPKAFFEKRKRDPNLDGTYNISAEWWGLTTASNTPNNARSHWTGSDKGHTTLLISKPRTQEDLRKIASTPKQSWHGGGFLNDEVGATTQQRAALVRRHADILRPQDKLNTTLEGESEYKLTKTQYEKALVVMKALVSRNDLGFKVTSKGEGKTEDTYYDFDNKVLMSKNILLRRRYVPANDKGKDLFLFALKAKNTSKEGLMVRLSSQFNMSERKVGTQLQKLTALLLDNEWNPFATIAKSALGGDVNLGELRRKSLQQAFAIHSSRQKFAITDIAGKVGQSIDVTLDEAYAVNREWKRTASVYSIEFGIDHPGASVVVKEVEAREHHIPTDLKDAVFTRPDVAPFKQVRNKSIGEINKQLPIGGKLDSNNNTGGFKAVVLSKLPFNLALPRPLQRSDSAPQLSRQEAPPRPRGVTRSNSATDLKRSKTSDAK